MAGKCNAGDAFDRGTVVSAEKNCRISVRLNEQNRSFAMDKNRPAQGVIRIDGDNINVNVQNLQQRKKGYELIFIGRRNNNSVYKIMANIDPDQNGNAALRLKVNPENVDGEGTSLSCFYVFMVAVMSRPIKPVLHGDCMESRKSSRQTRETDGADECKKVGEIAIPGNNMKYNSYYSEYIREKVAEFMLGKNMYTDISPFDDEWLADNWKRVTDVLKLPIVSIGAEKQIVKYGHFIYGFTDEHFYLGVPGRHAEEEWPEKGKSGFMLWQSIRGSEEYGYWMMVIDCKLGIITEIS